MIRYLQASIEEMPIRKTFDLDGEEYDFLFRHNDLEDFFTVEIYRDNELVYTTNLVYGWNLFHAYVTGPSFSVVPLLESDLAKEGYSDILVNKETLGKNVFLFFNDGL